MKNIEVGASLTVKQTVSKLLLASSMGSGILDVYATPAVVALMENAATELVQSSFDDGITTVGTMIYIEHIKAVPLNAEVTATATLTAIDGRKYCFDVIASDNVGIIAKGKHERFSVKIESFMNKVNAQSN